MLGDLDVCMVSEADGPVEEEGVDEPVRETVPDSDPAADPVLDTVGYRESRTVRVIVAE